MEVDSSDGNNSCTSSLNEKCLVAIPVVGGSSGVGLPYAPEDWPCPGDKWCWKVGKRETTSGHWHDRYLYAPPSCPKSGSGKLGFQSRVSVEEYIRKEFPHMDVNTFFSSFIWKVPCACHTSKKGTKNNIHIYTSSRCSDATQHTRSESTIGSENCRAGNKMCSIQAKAKTNVLVAKDCDICCSEAGFCHDCCCILCSQSVDWANGGYSFVRCEATLDENYICGHVAHLECAICSYMAGTVGGSIGLDVEYYCRRCDNKTDLMLHVTKILKLCESLESQVDVEKILNLGFRILRGSQQTRAKSLGNHIGLAIAKLKQGVHLDEIWKLEDNITTLFAGDMSRTGIEITLLGTEDIRREESKIDCVNEVDPLQKVESADRRAWRGTYITSDHDKASAELETKIDQVLEELKISQSLEYRTAEQKLYAEKDFLLSLYRHLGHERSELANPSLSNGGDCDALLSSVHKVDQIRQEEERFSKMMKIAKGFGSTPKSILEEYFGLAVDG